MRGGGGEEDGNGEGWEVHRKDGRKWGEGKRVGRGERERSREKV